MHFKKWLTDRLWESGDFDRIELSALGRHLVNPSPSQLKGFVYRTYRQHNPNGYSSWEPMRSDADETDPVRGLILDDDTTYWWDAMNGTHSQVAKLFNVELSTGAVWNKSILDPRLMVWLTKDGKLRIKHNLPRDHHIIQTLSDPDIEI